MIMLLKHVLCPADCSYWTEWRELRYVSRVGKVGFPSFPHQLGNREKHSGGNHLKAGLAWVCTRVYTNLTHWAGFCSIKNHYCQKWVFMMKLLFSIIIVLITLLKKLLGNSKFKYEVNEKLN